MPISIFGAPTAAEILGYFDPISTVIKPMPAALGVNASGETTTLSALASVATTKILGDGGSNPGIGNPALEASASGDLTNLILGLRWDVVAKRLGKALVQEPEDAVSSNMPSGWNFLKNGIQHILDAHLLRLNACHSGVPTTPAAAGTLTGVTNVAGTLPTTTSGNAPRLVHTLVGTYDFDESLPCAEATQVALSGSQNAYSYQIAGTVPTGVTKVRIYRGVFAGGTGFYYLLKTVAVTAGLAYPAILITEPDSTLRLDWIPPSWLSCLVGPEAAVLFALAFATAPTGSLSPDQPLQLSTSAILNAANVALGPSNGTIGYLNPAQSGVFGVFSAGAYTVGAIQAANNAAAGVQGFAGALKLRARVTATLNAGATPTISYTYFDAAHGYGNPQTVTGIAADGAIGTAVGSTCVWTIPAGRLVQSVTAFAASGITSGQIVVEAGNVRSY